MSAPTEEPRLSIITEGKQVAPRSSGRRGQRLTRNTRIAFNALLALQLLCSIAAIVLLSRMRPAINRIIEHNIHSLEAAEAMLAVLARPRPMSPVDQEAFRKALVRAESNISAEGEEALLGQLKQHTEGALAGDEQAIRFAVLNLEELSGINREEIERADHEAKRLGSAGAWAMSFLGLLALGGGLIGIRRFDRQVLAPLEELVTVLNQFSEGQTHRRSSGMSQATEELYLALNQLNQLLEQRASSQATEPRPRAGLSQPVADEGALSQAAFVALLDTLPEAALVLDERGSLIAANTPGFELLAQRSGLCEALMCWPGSGAQAQGPDAESAQRELPRENGLSTETGEVEVVFASTPKTEIDLADWSIQQDALGATGRTLYRLKNTI